MEARWVQKNGINHFGDKNHIQIDVANKFIRNYEVTDASVHDSQVFEPILDSRNSNEFSIKPGATSRFQKKEIPGNRSRAKIRSRIEHGFGIQAICAGDLIIRTIGIARAKVEIGLRNLAYNLDRYASFMLTLKVQTMMAMEV